MESGKCPHCFGQKLVAPFRRYAPTNGKWHTKRAQKERNSLAYLHISGSMHCQNAHTDTYQHIGEPENRIANKPANISGDYAVKKSGTGKSRKWKWTGRRKGKGERGNPPQGSQTESIRKMPIHLCHKQLQTQSDGNNS